MPVYQFDPSAGLIEVVGGETSDSDRPWVTLCLARDVEEITGALGALRWGLITTGLALALLMALVIAFGVNRGLRPVDRLAKRVSELDERSLGQNLGLPHLPSELQPIVAQFDALLERLGVAFERERRFSANLAHELCTPVAGLRATLDVALARPRSQEDYAVCLTRLRGITNQMQVMIEALLHLAALENGTVAPAFQPVNLEREIDSAWCAVAQESATAKNLDVRRAFNLPHPVNTDASLIGLILRNVLHNAATYTNDGGVIEITSAVANGAVEIRVTNSGSRVAAKDVPHVFDRFWRADQARSDTGSRFGLGLALSRLAARTMGGDITAESEFGGSFTIIVRLPD